MTFRIGRKHAQHTYPTPRFGALGPLLQVGSDLLEDPFGITADQAPLKVEKTAGNLLQVPLNGFQRVNGLWVEATALLNVADTGDAAMSYIMWVKFASLPETFIAFPPTQIGVGVDVSEVGDPAEQPLQGISLALNALIRLPAQSSDVAPIALPAVDDILVGLAGTGGIDFSIIPTTTVIAGEISSAIITQIPEVLLVTLP